MHGDAQVGAAAMTSTITLNNSHEEETVLIAMSSLFVGHGDALLRQESSHVFPPHCSPAYKGSIHGDYLPRMGHHSQKDPFC